MIIHCLFLLLLFLTRRNSCIFFSCCVWQLDKILKLTWLFKAHPNYHTYRPESVYHSALLCNRPSSLLVRPEDSGRSISEFPQHWPAPFAFACELYLSGLNIAGGRINLRKHEGNIALCPVCRESMFLEDVRGSSLQSAFCSRGAHSQQGPGVCWDAAMVKRFPSGLHSSTVTPHWTCEAWHQLAHTVMIACVYIYIYIYIYVFKYV